MKGTYHSSRSGPVVSDPELPVQAPVPRRQDHGPRVRPRAGPESNSRQSIIGLSTALDAASRRPLHRTERAGAFASRKLLKLSGLDGAVILSFSQRRRIETTRSAPRS